MEKIVNRQEAEKFLRPLVGQPLRYALKSPDTELYDFGFGKPVEVTRLFDTCSVQVQNTLGK